VRNSFLFFYQSGFSSFETACSSLIQSRKHQASSSKTLFLILCDSIK
jgi:hypothetical protein